MNITLDDIKPCLLDDHITVIATITNYGYLMYTFNMLKSLMHYGLDKKVFIICIDKKSADILKSKGYCVYCIDDISLSRFSPWNTKGYDKICYLKLTMIYHILSLKKNILLVDGDIVFQKSPMIDILYWQNDHHYDVWIQNDSLVNKNTENMCTGYMYIKYTDLLLQLYDCISEDGVNKYISCAFDNNDQTYFNKFVKPYCRICPLPLEKYPNGQFFYIKSKVLKKSTILVHFNWVIGHLKMAKMKEHGYWMLTPEEEETLM